MKKIKNTLIIIFLSLSINSNGQLAKIDLYPEGIECLNVIKQKIDFDDSLIYSEFKKSIKERKIPMIQTERDEALKAFELWNKKTDKVKY